MYLRGSVTGHVLCRDAWVLYNFMRVYNIHVYCHVPADKQVYPGLDVVGWYATGSQQEQDLDTHKQVGDAGK